MKILFIKNIPSPYRNQLFNAMKEEFLINNIEFEVWYMARREPNRYWRLDNSDFRYPYVIFQGWLFIIGNYFVHFNFKLLWNLFFKKYDCIVVGGAYSSPTHMLASLLLNRNSLRILWTEGNLQANQKTQYFFTQIKKYFISKYRLFLIPSVKTKELIDFFLPNRTEESFIYLPNLIDSSIYSEGVKIRKRNAHLRRSICDFYEINCDSLIFFSPSRLDHMKGFDLFIKSMVGFKNICLVIAGEGSLRHNLDELSRSLNVKVHFLGNKQQNDIVDLFCIADVFVLPSVWDPNPLAVIEALAAGLPVLVSPHIGNYYEVIEEGVNGWTFDPKLDLDSLRGIVKNICEMPREELKRMGLHSEILYQKNFDTRKVLKRLAIELGEKYDSFLASR